MAVSILINHHGRSLVAVAQAAGRQQGKAAIKGGLPGLIFSFFSMAA
jgi:hypothetical protein